MDHTLPPASPDPSHVRTRTAYHYLIHTLDASLPPPVPDSQEGRARRNQAAIAQIAALAPANPAEAALAAAYAAAHAQAMDCMRLTHVPETPGHLTLKCNAQAALMMRQAQGAVCTLLRLQATRRKQDADSDAATQAAWAEHCAAEWMQEALPDPVMPERTAIPAPSPVEPVQPPPAPLPSAPLPPAPLPSAPLPAMPQPDEPRTAPNAAADEYEHLYPQRAALIRRLGRVPEDASFGPPGDDVVRALLRARAPEGPQAPKTLGRPGA
jgi:hypothetical protein